MNMDKYEIADEKIQRRDTTLKGSNLRVENSDDQNQNSGNQIPQKETISSSAGVDNKILTKNHIISIL